MTLVICFFGSLSYNPDISHSRSLSGDHEHLNNGTLPLTSPSLGGNHPQSNDIPDPDPSCFPSDGDVHGNTSIDAILATALLSPTLPQAQAVKREVQPTSTKPWICNIDHCFRDYSSESRLIRHQRENHGFGKRSIDDVYVSQSKPHLPPSLVLHSCILILGIFQEVLTSR